MISFISHCFRLKFVVYSMMEVCNFKQEARSMERSLSFTYCLFSFHSKKIKYEKPPREEVDLYAIFGQGCVWTSLIMQYFNIIILVVQMPTAEIVGGATVEE